MLLQGSKEDAIARLHDVIEVDPSHGGGCNDLAWLLAESGKELDLALTLAQRATRTAPGPQTMDTLGWVQLKRGDADAATRIFERAVTQHGESPTRLYHLGLALGQKGDRARAVETLRKAVSDESFPEAAAVHAELARLEAL